MKEWKIEAILNNGHRIAWTYADLTDARKAWNHIVKKKTTPDTDDSISGAELRLPNGHIFYPGESVSWGMRK
jgi:hypothetical protein